MSYRSPEELQKEAVELLAEYKEPLKPKQRMAIPQQDMPSQDPVVRSKNMEEVAIGYTKEQVALEAMRCLQCKNAPCVAGCPVEIDIPKFIKEAGEGDYQSAINTIKESSILPAVCGRVCPQESQCMKTCTVGKSLKDPEKSVAIGRLERFVADWERENGVKVSKPTKSTGKKVGIVGAGPSGLTAAADLCKMGHKVVLFEAFHKAGGVAVYGIPEFRLPKAIVEQEVAILEKMGVEVHTNFLVGRTESVYALLEEDGFDILYMATGAGLPKFMNIPGEDLVGVYSANEFLTRSNLMKAYQEDAATPSPVRKGAKVAVIGGGNVAMDAARTAVRLGAEEVHIVYRRTEEEMPARVEEVHHAHEEGVIFDLLTSPTKIMGDEEGVANKVEFQKYKLGEPDESGRCRPEAIEGSEFTMDLDIIIMAIGSHSNPLIRQTVKEIEFTKWGTMVVDEDNKTTMDKVYAGGDIVQGAATVILAMGDGRRAAEAIDKKLNDK